MKYLFLLLGVLLLGACATIEKRHYAGGVYINWPSNGTEKIPAAPIYVRQPVQCIAETTADVQDHPFVTSAYEQACASPAVQMPPGIAAADTLPRPPGKNPPGNFKDDASLDATKKERKVDVFGVAGFVVAFFGYSLFWFTPVAGLLPVMAAAFLLCAFGIYRTRKKEGELNRPVGRALAIIGLIASGLVLLVYTVVALRGAALIL